jgi:hypothetical protein
MFNNHHDMINYYRYQNNKSYGKASKWYLTKSKNCKDNCKGWDGYSDYCHCYSQKIRWHFNNNIPIPKVINHD